MVLKRKPPKEWQTLFNQEWRRAKRELTPALDGHSKPRLYVAKRLHRSSWLGMHSGGLMTVQHKVNGRWVNAQHIITLRADHPADRLVATIRHEICHCVHQNHKTGFKSLLACLNR